MKKDTYIISLGGSLVATPAGIDWKFLRRFRIFLLQRIKKGERFFIVVGGGVTARNYIKAVDKIIKVSDEDRDWLGIEATRLNAHLLQTIFYDVACSEIIKDPTKNIKDRKNIIVSGGWKPGWSTDYVAIKLAEKYRTKTVINLSNIDYVYTADPRKNKNAKPIKEISWADFRKIVGDKWGPGLNAPFDPVASRLAQSLRLKVVIMNGKKLDNFNNCLENKKFKGTVIES